MIAAGFFFLLGALAGGACVWLLRRRSQAELHAVLEASLPRVAEAVLAPRTEQLERAAAGELRVLGAETVGQVQAAQAGMQATLESKLQEMAGRVGELQAHLAKLEQERAAGQATLQQQVAAVASAGAAMGQEARGLRQVLANSGGVRGAWGERTIQNILEQCGLNEGRDFRMQVSMEGGGDRLRPDAVVYVPPDGTELVIDAKASLADFLAGVDAPDEAARQRAFAGFAKVLRARARELAGKEYSRNLERSLPFVVMFVPSEGAFRAALDADAELFQYGQELNPKVLLASPSTLFPMVLVVAHGWQRHKAGEKMAELLREVKEFGDRVQTFFGHVQKIGKAVDDAGKAFNAAVASHRSRLAPQAAKLEHLHAGWNESAELKPVDNRPLLEAGDDHSAAAGE